MIMPVEMFASWYCIGIFDIFSVVIELVTNNKVLSLNNEAAFTVDSVIDFKPFVDLITFECCCGNKSLTAKATC